MAHRGGGTTLNGRRLQTTPGETLSFARIAGPKPLVARLSAHPDITLYPRIASLALRLCRVADGTLDATFVTGNSRDWDLAAADLIVREADGRLTELVGSPVLYNRRDTKHGVLVAAGRQRHEHIVARFRDQPL